jgi:hypothetical protein
MRGGHDINKNHNPETPVQTKIIWSYVRDQQPCLSETKSLIGPGIPRILNRFMRRKPRNLIQSFDENGICNIAKCELIIRRHSDDMGCPALCPRDP